MGGTGNSVRDGLRMLLSGVVQTSNPRWWELGAAGLVPSQLCALCARRAPRPRKLWAARGGSRPGFVVDVGVMVDQCSPVTARQRCSARAGDWRRSRCCGKGVGVGGRAGRIREAAAKRDGSSDDSEGSAESGWACGQRWGGMRRVLQYGAMCGAVRCEPKETALTRYTIPHVQVVYGRLCPLCSRGLRDCETTLGFAGSRVLVGRPKRRVVLLVCMAGRDRGIWTS